MFKGQIVALLALLLLSGCAGGPYAQIAAVRPSFAEPPEPGPQTGSLFNRDRFVAIVSDNRARRVGDLLTIKLVERTQSRKSASSDTKRDSSTDITLPKFPPFTSIPVGALNGGLAQGFKGSGTTAQDNLLSGEISVTVARVLPNGVLLVQGEKRLTLNRGEEQIQLSGMVRPDDIGSDNSVVSTRIANAQIRYGGTGEIAEQSRMGWLQRFFSVVSPL